MSLQIENVTMTESELKIILKEIKNGFKNWDEENNVLIVKSMLKHIGSTDSELRDQLIYTLFYRLIIERNQLEPEILIELLDISLREFLLKGIGENGTDTVFTRAFTTLLIALILYRDNEDNFLPSNTLIKVKDQLIKYVKQERDLRGYVPDKGWAHSIAHVADTFEEVIKSSKISHEFYSEILKTLWDKIFVSSSVYIHNEDERILIPILVMIDKGLETKEIEELLQSLPIKLKEQKDQLDKEKYFFLEFNCKTFLKSFYFKINKHAELELLKNSIEQCLSKI